MNLANRIGNRLAGNAMLLIVKDDDESLTLDAAKRAAEAYTPGAVEVLSPLNQEATEARIQTHKTDGKGTLIVPDLLRVAGNAPLLYRALREHALQSKRGRIILVEQTSTVIPETLVKDCDVITSKLPTVEDLIAELDGWLELYASKMKDAGWSLTGNGEEKFKLASAMVGLPRHNSFRLLCRNFAEEGRLDAKYLREAKAAYLLETYKGAISVVDVSECTPVGGMKNIKDWLKARMSMFNTDKARKLGLPDTKGLLIMGIPGTGKSALVKTIAQEAALVLLRLDVGAMFSSGLGDTEASMRTVIEMVEAASPNILWLDEMEKMLSGTKGGESGRSDGGTTMRMFSSMLTWMQEKTRPVLIVGTVNEMEQLNDALTRAGRFDIAFWVDQPTAAERVDIVNIHLKEIEKRKNKYK